MFKSFNAMYSTFLYKCSDTFVSLIVNRVTVCSWELSTWLDDRPRKFRGIFIKMDVKISTVARYSNCTVSPKEFRAEFIGVSYRLIGLVSGRWESCNRGKNHQLARLLEIRKLDMEYCCFNREDFRTIGDRNVYSYKRYNNLVSFFPFQEIKFFYWSENTVYFFFLF